MQEFIIFCTFLSGLKHARESKEFEWLFVMKSLPQYFHSPLQNESKMQPGKNLLVSQQWNKFVYSVSNYVCAGRR